MFHAFRKLLRINKFRADDGGSTTGLAAIGTGVAFLTQTTAGAHVTLSMAQL
jgi:Ethanolamine utilization protein EutJ (predicted chaperonin)